MLLWLRHAAEPPLNTARHDCSRSTRLRWLGSGRQDEEHWDAFLAPSGRPLADLVAAQGRLPWPEVRPILEQLMEELAQVRARGWALADEELAPGVRSVAVPVRDGSGAVRAAMNVTVHAAETSVDTLLDDHLPHLRRAAGEVSAEWALWQSRPHVEVSRPAGASEEPAEEAR